MPVSGFLIVYNFNWVKGRGVRKAILPEYIISHKLGKLINKWLRQKIVTSNIGNNFFKSTHTCIFFKLIFLYKKSARDCSGTFQKLYLKHFSILSN